MKGSQRVTPLSIVETAACGSERVDAPLELEALYRENAATVARWVARLAGPVADVEDLVHEVFVVVDARLGSFRGEAGIKTWLYAITANVVRQTRRKEQIRRWLLGERQAREIAPENPTPAEQVEAIEARRAVYAILDTLGERYRTVLILHELEELSATEIAELTGVKPATVWVRLHRARALFRARFEEEQRRRR